MLAPALLRVEVRQLDLVLLDDLAILPMPPNAMSPGAVHTAEKEGDHPPARTSSKRMKRVEDVPWSTLPTSFGMAEYRRFPSDTREHRARPLPIPTDVCARARVLRSVRCV